MWANLQARDNQPYAKHGNRRTSHSSKEPATKALLALPSSKNTRDRSDGRAPLLNRQNSSKSSVRSNNSKSNIQAKIEEHFLHSNTDDWKKEQEYKQRRRRWKQVRKQMDSKKALQYARYVYVPAGGFMVAGIIMLFGATIRSISDGTVFFTYREYFCIIGPVVLVAGIILLFIAIGVETHVTEKLKAEGVLNLVPVIHADFDLEKNVLRQRSQDSTSTSQMNDMYSAKTSRLLDSFKPNSLSESFNSAMGDISMRPSTSSPVSRTPNSGVDFSSGWVAAMKVRMDEVKIDVEATPQYEVKLQTVHEQVHINNQETDFCEETSTKRKRELDRLPSMPDSGVSFTVTDCDGDDDSRVCNSSVDSLYESETRYTYT